jgi:hypothetical protein
MPKVSDVFGGAYLKAEHYRDKPRVLTIAGVSVEMVYGEVPTSSIFTNEKRGIS